MVGCLKICGLLCALLTALQVCGAVNDYQCYEGKADDATKTVPMVTCGLCKGDGRVANGDFIIVLSHAFYRLSFSFSKGEKKKKNEAFVQTHKDMTIEYTIFLKRKQENTPEPTSIITLKGIPVKEQPLEFVTDHVADLDKVNVEVQLPGNAIGDSHPNLEFHISLENHLSGHVFKSASRDTFHTEPGTENTFTKATETGKYLETRYPRCVAFVTNSAKPVVIYGGCIKETGYESGSKVCRVREQGLDFTIKTCMVQCEIYPLSADSKSCPILDEVYTDCQEKIIKTADKNVQFELVKKLRSHTTIPTTPEPEDPSKNTSSTKTPNNPNTTKNTNSTPTGDPNTETTVHSHSSTTDTTDTLKATNDPPKNTTCKPESGSGAPIGLIVALVIFILGTLGALAVAGLYFFKHRWAVSTLEQQEDKVQEQEDKAKEQDKKVQELEQKANAAEKKWAELQETVDRGQTQRDATGTECTNSKSTEQTRKVNKKEKDTKKEPKKETKKETKNKKRYPETESERVLAKEKLDGTPGKAKWASAEDETTDTRTEKRWSHGDKKK